MQQRIDSRHDHEANGGRARRAHVSLLALWLLCLAMTGSQAWAAGGLSASVDRNELAVGETLQLTISSKLDASLGISLFNLNTLDIDSPDVTALEDDFEILDRQQNYRVQFENNVNNSLVAWTYTLSPKRAGTVTIPPLSLEDESTDAIQIEVSNAPKEAADSDLMVEMTIDKQSAYVGEQMLLTVKLLYSNELVDGQLAHPNVKGALFRQLEKQKEYSQTRAGKRFEVVERQYAVFAEDSGQLDIPAVKFSGRFVNRRFGRGRYETVASQPVDVEIMAPPADFSGKTWLPAMGFSISENYDPDITQLKVGESVTRTISLQGLGLESATLPPVNADTPDGVRLYPGQSEMNEEIHAAGITGMRSQEYAMIATRPGRFVLPEIRIPWWDVVNDEQRVAILPERVLQVTGTGSGDIPALPLTAESGEAGAETPLVSAPESVETGNTNEVETSWFWPVVSLILALLSLGLGWLAWHYRQLTARIPRQARTFVQEGLTARQIWTRNERAAFVGMTPCSFASAYSSWLQKQSARQDVSTDEQILGRIRAELTKLQQHCFGSHQDASDTSTAAIQTKLVELTDQWLSQSTNRKNQETSLAQSLYPN